MKLITKNNLWIWIICIIIVAFLLRIFHKKSLENFEISMEAGGSMDIGNVPLSSTVSSTNILPPINTTYINPKNQIWTSQTQNQNIIINEENLVKTIQFGQPLGNSVSAHEKINRVINGIKNELIQIFSQIPETMMNIPLNKLPSPMDSILNQSLSSLFPVTSAAMNMPLNKLLNTENSLNQIADLLQPPSQ